MLQCTHHMCRVRVHWHVKFNYKDYWRAKIAIINFDYRMNYTQWTLVVQHPNLNNVTQVFSFEYKPLLPYESISEFLKCESFSVLQLHEEGSVGFCNCGVHNWLCIVNCADDTGMFYGLKYYNDLLMQAGPLGNVQSEVLMKKDKNTFTLKQGWAFPRKVYFNGDECMLPPPDLYPTLPNSAYKLQTSISLMVAYVIFTIFFHTVISLLWGTA